MAAPRQLDLTVTLADAWKLWGEDMARRIAADTFSPETRRNYLAYARRGIHALGPGRACDSIEAAEVQQWIADYKTGGASSNTLRMCHKALKGLLDYADANRWLRENPMRDVPAPSAPPKRTNRPERSALSRPELEALIAAAQTGKGSFLGDRGSWIRDEIVIRLAGESGLRNADIQNLDLGDIETDPSGHWVVQIRRGKGRKARTVPLTDACATLIRDYVENWRPKPAGLPDRVARDGIPTRGDAQALLLTGAYHHRLNKASVRAIVSRCAKSALGRHYVPHGLRHTTGTLLAREAKADPALIAHILGHSDISVTSVYLDTTNDEAAAAVNRRKVGAKARAPKELPPGRDDPRWPECGTKEGWLRHRRERIPKCRPCLMWKREDVQRAELRALERALARRDQVIANQATRIESLLHRVTQQDLMLASQSSQIESLREALKADTGRERLPRLVDSPAQSRCGTPGGYKRHRKLGQAACRACLDAIAEYSREHAALSGSVRPKGPCPGCGQLRALTAAGVMRKHGCAGDGQPPTDAAPLVEGLRAA